MTMSLREQLGARPDPQFELALPRGWERAEPTQETEAELERRLNKKFMAMGDVQTMQGVARMRSMMRRSMQDMRDRRVVAYFAPTAPGEAPSLPVPASIVATYRVAPSAAEMDGYVKGLILKEGARALTQNRSILRVERESVREESGQELAINSTIYVTPVPGAGRKRALELIAGYARPADLPRDDEQIEGVHLFLDLMVSSLTWREASSA